MQVLCPRYPSVAHPQRLVQQRDAAAVLLQFLQLRRLDLLVRGQAGGQLVGVVHLRLQAGRTLARLLQGLQGQRGTMPPLETGVKVSLPEEWPKTPKTPAMPYAARSTVPELPPRRRASSVR